MRPRRLVAGAVVAGGAAFASFAFLAAPPHGASPADLRADAALVLSGDVDYLRVRRAAALQRAGAVGWLVLTGAGIGGDSAERMKEVAVRMGVPEAAILVEPTSRTTRENLLFAAPLLRARGFTKVALVTSESHMGRAERAARRVAPEIEWRPVRVADAGPASRVYRQRAMEWLKLAGYYARGWL